MSFNEGVENFFLLNPLKFVVEKKRKKTLKSFKKIDFDFSRSQNVNSDF